MTEELYVERIMKFVLKIFTMKIIVACTAGCRHMRPKAVTTMQTSFNVNVNVKCKFI